MITFEEELIFEEVLKKSRLTEKRIKATNEKLELLRSEAKKNPNSDLYKNLFTQIGKNPRYEYFAPKKDYNIRTTTLSSIIQVSINDEGKGFVPFFIMDNFDNFIGFISYVPDDMNPKIIREIKAFNFSEKPNIIIAKDILNLIDDLIDDHDEINWSALQGNKAVKSYDRYILEKEQEGYNIFRNPPFGEELDKYDQIFYSIRKKII